jgi:hypothetical protein
MIIYEDGSWLCGEDETTIPDGAMIISDNTRLADEIKQYAKVRLMSPTNGFADLDSIQVIPIEDRHSVILAELDRLDLQAVRPLRAIAAGTATETDRKKLAEIEEQAVQLRQELANITAE